MIKLDENQLANIIGAHGSREEIVKRINELVKEITESPTINLAKHLELQHLVKLLKGL